MRVCLGPFLILLACLGMHLPAQAAPAFEGSMAQRTLACTACHGAQGRAGPDGYYPRLAGKPAGYLLNQLQNFRAARRHYPLMSGLLGTLSDDYLRDIAAHFASLSVPYPPPKASTADAATLERGRTLVLEGRAAQGLPACVQCHGSALMGVNPATPGLLGLPADYLNAQLGGWQTGQRQASAPDCMARIARMLEPADTHAIAQWLASQAVRPHAQVAATAPAPGKAAIDMPCGSTAPRVISANSPIAAGSTQSAQVARGAYLARIGNCAPCHTAPGGAPYAGGRAIDTPFGVVRSSNITPDATHGIGPWTALDFWQALHQGLSKDGHALYPAFPYTSFTHISRDDADALYAYLRTVAPVAAPRQPHALGWPYGSALALRVWRALFFRPAPERPTAPTGTPDQALARGAYLVQGLAHCMECHAARNALGALRQSPQEAGMVLPGSPWWAPALSDGAQASAATWSVPEIAAFLTTGMNARATAGGPMAEVVLHGTQFLSPSDAQAIALYLKALPQVGAAKATDQPTEQATPHAATSAAAKLYEIHCADCHGQQGQGRPGAYPALAGNRVVTQQPPNNLILSVLYGGFAPSTAGNPRPYGMPPFVLQLSDAELAGVLSYIRSAWGNRGAGVSEFDINKLRRAQSP